MIKNFKEYLNESSGGELTQEQRDWLDECTVGKWQLNPQTGLVDVQGYFDCSNSKLDSFKGVQFGHVSGDFRCKGNQLTSLEGAPQSVGGDFSCSRNNLTSLLGAPQSVGGNFWCHTNRLTSLKGFPMQLGGMIYLDPNPIWKEIEPLVSGMSDDEKRFFYKFVAASEATDKESLEKIARSIERMRMI